MFRAGMSILRGASCADAVRVLATAAVSGAAATILLCLLGWARATGRGGPAVAGPLLAALPVLATVGVLTAVGTRLAVLHRIDRTAVPHSVDVPVRRIRGLAASEAVATALVGAIAGVQAHLVVRALLGSAPAPIRRLLAEGTGVPWVGLVAVLAVVPAIAGPAAAFAVHLPSRRLLPRIPPYLGPLLVLAGLLAQYLIADPARPGELPRGALPAAVSGYGAVLVGAALTVPWFVTWIGTGWAARAGRAWSLCAARRIEASARGLALPLGLATIALAVVTTTRFAGVHTPVRMRDAPLFLTIATVSLCAAAILFLVTVEYGSARRETSRTLHALGATAPVDRRAALAALTVPVLVCAVTAVAVGALAAWPAREGSPFPTVSTGTATLGTVWAIVLLASAVICAGFVILRDERPRRRERA